MALALTFLAFILLRVLLVALTAAFIVRPVRACPACFRQTVPVLMRWLERLTPFEWRWCMHCGWRGVARRRPADAAPPRPGSAPGRLTGAT